MSTRKKLPKKIDTTSINAALIAFERSEPPFYEGMKLLKTAQNDFNECAKNKNLYSHALRALRYIAKQKCETGPWGQGYKTCNEAIEAGDHPANDRCWPCYARDALRQGGDKP